MKLCLHCRDQQLGAVLPPTLLMPGLRLRHVATLQHRVGIEKHNTCVVCAVGLRSVRSQV